MSILNKSKYTLADIDTIFKDGMPSMALPERYTIYNHAQNEIADLLNDIYQITNFTVVDNTLIYSSESEHNRINPLTEEEKEAIKLGTIDKYHIDSIIQDLYDIENDKKLFILNIAQDIIARFKNRYDRFGYYQLWYNADPDVFIKENNIIEFSTEFSYVIDANEDIIKNVEFNTDISYKLYGVIITTYINRFDFGSDFEYNVASIISETINNNLEFSTTFTGLVVTPILKTESNIFDFGTTYSVTVV